MFVSERSKFTDFSMAVWITGCLAFAAILSLCQASPEETQLINHLMNGYHRGGYGPVLLPRSALNDTVHVKLGAALIDFDIDTEKELLHSQLWLRYLWKDPQLTWNSEDFGGIDTMRIPISLIWRPDIKLYNSHTLRMEQDETSLAVVYHDGSVLWIPMTRTTTWCQAKKEEKDVWVSHLKFGSWTYDGFSLSLAFFEGLEELDLSDFVQRNWNLLRHDAQINVKYYPCCPEPYPDITFRVEAESIKAIKRTLTT